MFHVHKLHLATRGHLAHDVIHLPIWPSEKIYYRPHAHKMWCFITS